MKAGGRNVKGKKITSPFRKMGGAIGEGNRENQLYQFSGSHSPELIDIRGGGVWKKRKTGESHVQSGRNGKELRTGDTLEMRLGKGGG